VLVNQYVLINYEEFSVCITSRRYKYIICIFMIVYSKSCVRTLSRHFLNKSIGTSSAHPIDLSLKWPSDISIDKLV